VIGKITAPRGERVEGLIYYLFGPGQHEEHTDPHIVAGWRHPAELEPPLRADGRRDFRRLIGLLSQPHAAMGAWGLARPVWHCSMRSAPEDKMLSDDEWAQIACDVMHRTGLSPFGQEDDAVRWVAIRHGDDHIHIVAMLARQDGRHPRVRNDRYRVREACLATEHRYGLRRTAPGDRTAAWRPARAESEKADRRGLEEAPRITLRRQVSTAAATAPTEEDFFVRLRRSGVFVRARRSTRDPDQLTGYAVALPGDTTNAGDPVWYGGGKLAADLTLPKLRRRWDAPGGSADDPFTAAERSAVWDYAVRAAFWAAAQLQALAETDPACAADAAWATAGTLHAAAAVLASRILRQAADAYDRAARMAYGRIPPRTPAGDSLRRAARLLSAYGYLTSDPSFQPIVLITRSEAGLREPDADPGPDRHAGQRGHRIVQQLQSRAMAERGYALSPAELATTLGATTTLPSDVIARLVRADDQNLVAAGTERVRADDPGSVAAGPSPRDGIMYSEHFAPASNDGLSIDTASVPGGRTAAQLASESFPCTAADAVMAAASSATQGAQSSRRIVTVDGVRRPGLE
jgi:hypothetical protein